jgi:hypothetical protein
VVVVAEVCRVGGVALPQHLVPQRPNVGDVDRFHGGAIVRRIHGDRDCTGQGRDLVELG